MPRYEAQRKRKQSCQNIICSTEITSRNQYIEAYRKEKEAWGLDNFMTPLSSAEERALWEECRSVINQASGLLGGAVTLDYMDHAVIGLAYNAVRTYAEENLTWRKGRS